MDVIWSEKNGILAVAITPTGRLKEMSMSTVRGTPMCWVFTSTHFPIVNEKLSGSLVQGKTFLQKLTRIGLIVTEGLLFVPFSSPGTHNFDIEKMAEQDGLECRQDGPKKNAHLMHRIEGLLGRAPEGDQPQMAAEV